MSNTTITILIICATISISSVAYLKTVINASRARKDLLDKPVQRETDDTIPRYRDLDKYASRLSNLR